MANLAFGGSKQHSPASMRCRAHANNRDSLCAELKEAQARRANWLSQVFRSQQARGVG
jgi:hypothetical protein